MLYTVEYTQQAIDDLAELPKVIARRIDKKLNWFIVQEQPLIFAKHLNNFSCGHYRFRVGDYRVLFDVDKKGTISILMILRIKRRKEVYDI